MKKYISNLSAEQRNILRTRYRGAEETPSRIYFDIILGPGGGADPTEQFLCELIDEGAISRERREDRDDGGFKQMYRFQPWFFDYLSENPTLMASEASD